MKNSDVSAGNSDSVKSIFDTLLQVGRDFVKFVSLHHREHTILLSRERVNKGMKRMNSLRLSLHLISSILRDFTGKTTA